MLPLAYVGSAVSPELSAVERAVEPSGNLFQRRLLLALQDRGATPFIVTFLPVATFPRDRRMVISGGSEPIDPALPAARFITFLNVPVLKQVSQCFSIFLALAPWLNRHRGGEPVVLLYNVFSPHALAVLVARACFGGRVVAIVADLPIGLYDFRGFHGLLQRADLWIQTTSLRFFDGLVPLTRQTSEDFAPRVPAMVLEGAIEAQDNDAKAARAPELPSGKAILFSGTLYSVNGIELLLAAFARIQDPEYRLWIFGRGPLEGMVRAAAAADSRIVFFGFVPNATVVQRQREAAALANPRPPALTISRYTFPSKLMEYMISGRPVVTTRLPSLPAEYEKFLILADDTPASFAKALRAAVEAPSSAEMGRAAREFVLRSKSWPAQALRLRSFLGSLRRTEGTYARQGVNDRDPESN